MAAIPSRTAFHIVEIKMTESW